jgi:hypothetical protein
MKHLDSLVILNMCFYGEGLLAPRLTPKLEDHPSSAVRVFLFNLFTATLHIGGRSSIRNLRTRHAVVTGTHIHGTAHYKPTISSCCEILWINVGNKLLWEFAYPLRRNRASSPNRTRVGPVLPHASPHEGTTSSQNSLRFTICFVDFVNNGCLMWM